MGWRNLSVTNVFIGNFFFVAGIGMVVSAQWELALGNSYGYTVLSAFGLFYGGFGAIITPLFGVKESYGEDLASYNNALGFWVLSKLVFRSPNAEADNSCDSVGRLESVLSRWIIAAESCLYRNSL
jgi:succinate-acetate transporter protein